MHETRLQRRLAAILVADVVGYSRLIGQDESGTLRQIKAIRREIVDPNIAQCRGRVVKTTGDGILIEFPSAVEAVRCAVLVQQATAKRAADIPVDNRIAFRVGIHQGDVVVEDQDIFGDGVNIAARLETLSEPGGVCVSERVYEDTVGRFELPFEDRGEQQVKNIARPVRVYSLSPSSISELPPFVSGDTGQSVGKKTIPGLWLLEPQHMRWVAGLLVLLGVSAIGTWQFTRHRPSQPVQSASVLAGAPTVGVLPFDNLSGDPSQNFFSEGISEELITVLSRFEHLRVLARNTTFVYKGQAIEIPALGRKLGAQYIIEGSFRRVPDQISVTAQLIETRNGTHIWAKTYEGQISRNFLQIQDEIAQKIGAAIADNRIGEIALTELERSKSKPANELSSYECIVQAYAPLIPTVVEPVRRSRECLETVIRRDPGYAEGWALLSNLLTLQRQWGTALNPYEAGDVDKRAYLIDRIVETANRAVDLGPRSVSAHYALFRAYYTTCQAEKMRVEADRVLALNPNDAGSMAGIGNMLGYAGEWELGRQLAEKGLALAGAGAARWWWWVVAKDYYRKGEYEKALEYFQRSYVEQNWLDHLHLVYTLPYVNRTEEARAQIDKLLKLKPEMSVHEADRYYKMWCFDEDFRARMVKALRLAGLREETTDPVQAKIGAAAPERQ